MKAFVLTIMFCMVVSFCYAQKTIRVGAKHFTEGYILSEIQAQLLESNGFNVDRKFNLGGTLVCFEALNNGEIDVYPEYTGTIEREILKGKKPEDLDLEISKTYGFSNSYSLVVRKDSKVRRLSDLAGFTGVFGISYEFLERGDGWQPLSKTYGLSQKPVALEHGLAYQALLEKKIDVTDCYSTDGEISVNNLVVLEDDKDFFPRYDAVSFYRSSLDREAIKALASLNNMIDEKEMSAMNAQAIYGKKSFETIAHDFLVRKKLVDPLRATTSRQTMLSKIGEHLVLTFTALLLAIIAAIPLGIFLHFKPGISNYILYLAGLLQTIPSIALLAFMIPLFGIGVVPAIVALFLYAILPILRNTVNGFRSVDPLLKEVTAGLGMSPMQALRYVEWPLALPAILTGIRIAAVINVGTATLAAFIGAGGLGEYIVTGLALNNTQMILKGALPAAALALVIELVFELVERRSLPAHLRKR